MRKMRHRPIRALTWAVSVFLAGSVLTGGITGCKFKRNSRTSQADQKIQVSDNVKKKRAEIARYWGDERDRLLAKYSNTEFEGIVREVFSRSIQALNDPESMKVNSKVFVLNSLPGTGKSSLVTELAASLRLPQERFKWKVATEGDTYLDFTGIKDLGYANVPETYQNIVYPGILLVDEYTNATTISGEAYLKSVNAPLPPYLAEKYTVDPTLTDQEKSRRANEIREKRSSAKDQFDLNFNLFWNAAGGGVLKVEGQSDPKPYLENVLIYSNQYQALFIRLREQQERAAIAEEELSKIAGNVNDTAIAIDIDSMSDTEKAAREEATKINAQITEKSELKKSWEGRLAAAKTQIDDMERQRNSLLEMVKRQFNSVNTYAPQLASILTSDMDYIGMSLAEWRAGANMSEFERSARQRAFQPDYLAEQFKGLSRVEQMTMLFDANPSEFITRMKATFAGFDSSTEIFTGNVFIFMAANIFEIQDKVRTAAQAPGACNGINRTVSLSKDDVSALRDPDCIATMVTKIKDTPEGQLALDNALYQVFGKQNEQALFARIQGPRDGGRPGFITPPSGAKYLEAVNKNLIDLAASYQDEVNEAGLGGRAKLAFDPSVATEVYRVEIDGMSGFRSISNRARDHIGGFIDYKVKPRIIDLYGANLEGKNPIVSTKSADVPAQVVISLKVDPKTQRVEYKAMADGQELAKESGPLKRPFAVAPEAVTEFADEFLLHQRAAFIAGELGIGTLFMGSAPPGNYSLKMPIDTSKEIKEWTLPEPDLWTFRRLYVLLHLAGMAAENVYSDNNLGNSNEAKSRFLTARRLIKELYVSLRDEARSKGQKRIEEIVPKLVKQNIISHIIAAQGELPKRTTESDKDWAKIMLNVPESPKELDDVQADAAAWDALKEAEAFTKKNETFVLHLVRIFKLRPEITKLTFIEALPFAAGVTQAFKTDTILYSVNHAGGIRRDVSPAINAIVYQTYKPTHFNMATRILRRVLEKGVSDISVYALNPVAQLLGREIRKEYTKEVGQELTKTRGK